MIALGQSVISNQMNKWLTKGKMLLKTGMGITTQKIDLPREYVISARSVQVDEIMLRAVDGKKVTGGIRLIWDKPGSGIYKGERVAIKKVVCREFTNYIIYLPRDDD